MLFSLPYMVLRGVLRLALAADERDRESEILVLRHQVKVLKRKTYCPKLSRLDKLFLAAGSRVLPKERWSSFVVTPTTLLRWHRELVRRKWTYKAKPNGETSHRCSGTRPRDSHGEGQPQVGLSPVALYRVSRYGSAVSS